MKALSDALRRSIIDQVLEIGGNRATQFIPVPYRQIAEHFIVAANTVKTIW